jgi:hypothetical protein
MSTRETICAQFAADMATAIKAAYPWAPVGCSRELPGDPRVVDQISPESTPLVYCEEGDEEYPEYANGLTRVKLPIMLTGVLRRSARIAGPMQTAANNLLAVVQRTAWNWKHQTIPIEVLTAGPSPTNCGPDQARVGVDVAILFWIDDKNP